MAVTEDITLAARFGYRQNYDVIRNDGTVTFHYEGPEYVPIMEEEPYKLNMRDLARKMNFETFRKVHEAVLGVALETACDQSYLESGPEQWQRVEQASAVIIDKHSDNRGYHSIYHVMEMLGDPGDPLWKALGSLTVNDINDLDSRQLAMRLQAHMAEQIEAGVRGYADYAPETIIQDISDNILAANFHDIIQKSDSRDVEIDDEGNLVSVYQTDHPGWPLRRANEDKLSVEERSINSAGLICDYLGIGPEARRNMELFTRVTEHQAFFGDNHPETVRREMPEVSEDDLIRAYRFQRRDVSNFIAKTSAESENGKGELDLANFDGRINSPTTGSGGVAQEEVTDLETGMLRYKENRTLTEEMRFWKGMGNIADMNIDGLTTKVTGAYREEDGPTPMFFDPRVQTPGGAAPANPVLSLALEMHLDEMNREGVEMFGLMAQISQCRLAACALACAAEDSQRRMSGRTTSDIMAQSASDIFNAISHEDLLKEAGIDEPHRMSANDNRIPSLDIDALHDAIPTHKLSYEDLVSGEVTALDPRVVDQLAYQPVYVNGHSGVYEAGVLGQMYDRNPDRPHETYLDQPHSIHKGLINEGDWDSLGMVAVLGYEIMRDIDAETRGWIKEHETAMRNGGESITPILTVIPDEALGLCRMLKDQINEAARDGRQSETQLG